ncbi:MAG TPA: creatininase family protein [bacterium]|nr:creatininase family protein [bacterium]
MAPDGVEVRSAAQWRGRPQVPYGLYLEELTWEEAEPILGADPLVVIPVGAAAKEHGPHLPLGTDRIIAEYCTRQLVTRLPVLAMPTVTYGYFPHFSPFPGSTHLEADTFEAMMKELILSVHRHGPRRFFVLNTGVSTYPVLEIVARDLDRFHRIVVGVTRIGDLGAHRTSGLLSQPKGSHADEHETSLLMAIAPAVVRRDRAPREIPDRPDARGLFVPPMYHRDLGPGHSATGVYGDATLATSVKGVAIAEAIVDDLVTAAELLRTVQVAPARPGIPYRGS